MKAIFKISLMTLFMASVLSIESADLDNADHKNDASPVIEEHIKGNIELLNKDIESGETSKILKMIRTNSEELNKTEEVEADIKANDENGTDQKSRMLSKGNGEKEKWIKIRNPVHELTGVEPLLKTVRRRQNKKTSKNRKKKIATFVRYIEGPIGSRVRPKFSGTKRIHQLKTENATPEQQKIISDLFEDMKCKQIYKWDKGQKQILEIDDFGDHYVKEVLEYLAISDKKRSDAKYKYILPGDYKLRYFKPKKIVNLEYCKNKMTPPEALSAISEIRTSQIIKRREYFSEYKDGLRQSIQGNSFLSSIKKKIIGDNPPLYANPFFYPTHEKVAYDDDEMRLRSNPLYRHPHILRVIRIDPEKPKKQLQMLINMMFLGDSTEFKGVYQSTCYYSDDKWKNYDIMYFERVPYGDFNTIKDAVTEMRSKEVIGKVHPFYFMAGNSITIRIMLAWQVLHSVRKLFRSGYAIENFSVQNLSLVDRYTIRLTGFENLRKLDDESSSNMDTNLRFENIFKFSKGTIDSKLLEEGGLAAKITFPDEIVQVIENLIIENINSEYKSDAENVFKSCVTMMGYKSINGGEESVKANWKLDIIEGLEARLTELDSYVARCLVDKLGRKNPPSHYSKCYPLSKLTDKVKRLSWYSLNFKFQWFGDKRTITFDAYYWSTAHIYREMVSVYIICEDYEKAEVCKEFGGMCIQLEQNMDEWGKKEKPQTARLTRQIAVYNPQNINQDRSQSSDMDNSKFILQEQEQIAIHISGEDKRNELQKKSIDKGETGSLLINEPIEDAQKNENPRQLSSPIFDYKNEESSDVDKNQSLAQSKDTQQTLIDRNFKSIMLSPKSYLFENEQQEKDVLNTIL